MKNEEMIDTLELEAETSDPAAPPAAPPAGVAVPGNPGATLGAGTSDPWGANPADNAPVTHGVFNPSYICLLHIRFDSDWKLKINHASYEYQDTQTPEKRLSKALGIFTAKILGGYEFGDQTMQDLGHVSYEWQYRTLHQPGRTRDSTTFSDFKFKSPTEIFIFLESPTVYVGPKERLLACTKYGYSRTAPMDLNYAFYGADSVPDAGLGQLLGKGKLIRVQNHAKIAGGHPVAVDQNYALNIHLKVPGGAAGLVPIIIDPDTGNGQGNEP